MKRINWDIIIEWACFFWIGVMTGIIFAHLFF